MRILLTGASGFVGVHLAARLASAGHQLFVLPSPRFEPSRLNGIAYQTVTDAARARARRLSSGEPAKGAVSLGHKVASVVLRASPGCHVTWHTREQDCQWQVNPDRFEELAA